MAIWTFSDLCSQEILFLIHLLCKFNLLKIEQIKQIFFLMAPKISQFPFKMLK